MTDSGFPAVFFDIPSFPVFGILLRQRKNMKKRVFSISSLLIGLLEALVPCMMIAVALGAMLYTVIGRVNLSSISDFLSMEKEVWAYILEYLGNFLLFFAVLGSGLGVYAAMRKEAGFESFAGFVLCSVMAAYFLLN